MYLGDYYVKHFPRFDKFNGDPIFFKKTSQYFSSDFNSYSNMTEWCKTAPKEEVKAYILNKSKQEFSKKGLKKVPSTLYFKTSSLPDVGVIRDVFGSFGNFCKEINCQANLTKGLPNDFWNDFSDCEILIDTRETKELSFKNSKKMKLDFGDYTLTPSEYTHTHVERKSFEDFAGTVTNGYKRFLRELKRCQSVDCFLFIVIDEDIENIEDVNKSSYKKFNLEYVFHQMRKLEILFPDCCQFVFSGSRQYSEELIPKVLRLGRDLWKVDLQYFWGEHLKKHGLDNRRSKTTKSPRGYTRKVKTKRGLFGRGGG